jgi:ABC-type sulfate/molybdate transport systems ATPase subunit
MTHGLVLDTFRSALPGAPVIGPVSLNVAAGEVMALLGPSGAGKTTLLRAIAGLIPATGGVRVAGTDRGAAAPEARDIVYLHQSPRLFPHLDVAGNVAFPMRLRRAPDAVVRDRVRALLDLVQLGPLAGRRIEGLSGGERQRVALARALAADPQVLLLDEPFAALDPSLRAEVRAALEAVLRSARLATMLVTHDLEEAGWLAHRAGVLLDGALVQVDTPMHLFAAPANLAIAAFLEIPNRWTRQEAAVLLSDLPATATHVVLPAAGVRAVADPSGSARVERLLPSRERLRVTLRLGEVAVIAEVVGAPLHPGDRVTLQADADRATCFDGTGRRITPAVSNRSS